ncbi:HAD family hydrolase [Marinilabiliaceae bacterium JC017]|nr:HAD family hydrolase [Marinilabiliaceae bacterium JC017]
MIPIYSSIKAIFFDMDGVLYDSMKNHEVTWVESLKKYGIDFPPREAYMNEGRTGYKTIEIAFKEYANKVISQKDKETIYNEKTRLMHLQPKAAIMEEMPRLMTFLQQRNIRTFVVTGSRQPLLLDKLHNDYNIESDHVISGFDVKKGKPDPEPYLIALERSGFKKEECMVVENAPLGIQAAKAAGIFTVALNTGILDDQTLIDAGADLLYPDTRHFAEDIMKQMTRE